MTLSDLPLLPAESPRSIRALKALDEDVQRPVLSFLVPPELETRYGLPTQPSWRKDGLGIHRIIDVHEPGALRIEVYPDPAGEDPGLALELTDTYFGQIEASWIVINDVDSPRFNVDRDASAVPEALGSPLRNLREELRALAAGLAPNQVRAGLRLFAPLISRIEQLAAFLGVDTLYVAPLAYHNAIKYEKYGFTYSSGQEELEWIHREFGPGGVLRRRMDGSRPFRMPWMAETTRGRSWAIHDGVLDRRWMAPQMYKFVGRGFSTRTFPNAPW